MFIPENLDWLTTILKQRRTKLAELVNFPVMLWSGKAISRNFPANHFSFRPR
jgi:Xaa-Pro aminopeptidase